MVVEYTPNGGDFPAVFLGHLDQRRNAWNRKSLRTRKGRGREWARVGEKKKNARSTYRLNASEALPDYGRLNDCKTTEKIASAARDAAPGSGTAIIELTTPIQCWYTMGSGSRLAIGTIS
jgi:hypothetical protein